jgi:hypothetical protein
MAIYKHYIPYLNLSIERYSSRVPNDGKYYVILAGEIIGKYPSRKKAEEKFYNLVKQSGYKPNPNVGKALDATDEAMEEYALSKDIFWAEGPKRRQKGGRGGRGGI